MDEAQQLRNLKDFLLVYNRMTEICFQRCTTNFNYRALTMDEERCVDSCAGKLIRSNHRLMGTYVQLMPGMVQRRMEEMEKKAAELDKAEAQAAAAAGGGAQSEIPALPAPVTSDIPAAAVMPDMATLPALTPDAQSTGFVPEAIPEAVPRLPAILIPPAETPAVNGLALSQEKGSGAAEPFVLPRMPAPELSTSVASFPSVAEPSWAGVKEVTAPVAVEGLSTPIVSTPSVASIASLGISEQKNPLPIELPSAITTPATAAVELPTTSIPAAPVAISVAAPLIDSSTSGPGVALTRPSPGAIAPVVSAVPVLSPPSDTAPGSQSSS